MGKKWMIWVLCVFFLQGALFCTPAGASIKDFMDTFGAPGWRLTKIQYDDEIDGVMDMTAFYVYNSNNRLESIENDMDGAAMARR